MCVPGPPRRHSLQFLLSGLPLRRAGGGGGGHPVPLARSAAAPAPADDDKCPDGKTSCSASATCCPLSSGGFACCPEPNAVCCPDHIHCCPQGTKCDVKDRTCLKVGRRGHGRVRAAWFATEAVYLQRSAIVIRRFVQPG